MFRNIREAEQVSVGGDKPHDGVRSLLCRGVLDRLEVKEVLTSQAQISGHKTACLILICEFSDMAVTSRSEDQIVVVNERSDCRGPVVALRSSRNRRRRNRVRVLGTDSYL